MQLGSSSGKKFWDTWHDISAQSLIGMGTGMKGRAGVVTPRKCISKAYFIIAALTCDLKESSTVMENCDVERKTLFSQFLSPGSNFICSYRSRTGGSPISKFTIWCRKVICLILISYRIGRTPSSKKMNELETDFGTSTIFFRNRNCNCWRSEKSFPWDFSKLGN